MTDLKRADWDAKLNGERPYVMVSEIPGGGVSLRLCTPKETLIKLELDFDEIEDFSLICTKALWNTTRQWR